MHSWYVTAPPRSLAHITRTNIAGCQTLCGITMRPGWELSTSYLKLCDSCAGHARKPFTKTESETHR